MPGRSSQPPRLALTWPKFADFQNDNLFDDNADDDWVPIENYFTPMSPFPPFPNNGELYNFEEDVVDLMEQEPVEVQRMRSPSPPPTPCFTRTPSPTASEFDIELMDDVFYDELDVGGDNIDYSRHISTPQFEPYAFDIDYDYYWDDRSRA